METSSEHPPALPPRPIRYGRGLRKYFFTGLATLLPVVVTLWLVLRIFLWADSLLGRYFGTQIPGLGLLATCLIILLVGVLSIHVFGRVISSTLDFWFTRIPFVKLIYPAIKQVAEFIFNNDEEGSARAFRRVVLIEYPRPNSYALAFVTNEAVSPVLGSPQKLVTVLVPNPPSPFSGPVLFLPEKDVIDLSMTVEEALKLVVSAGVVGSPLKRAKA